MRRTSPLAFAALLLAAPAFAQQRPAAPAPPVPAPPGRAWTVNCAETPATPPRNCQLGTGVMIQPQNQRIAQVILLRQPETRSLSLMFQMPHGALLPPGMSWRVDDREAQRLAYQNSTPDGLFAGVPVTDEVLASLRRGTTLRVSFVAVGNRQEVMLPVPLAGFDAAVTEFFASESRAR